MSEHQLKFEREKTALKYFLIGRNYHVALKALGFAEQYHTGLRKDGKTPEFHHQVQIALSILLLRDLSNEEFVITVAILHDVQEDYQIPSETIEKMFGKTIRDATWRMTKKFGKTHKSHEEYVDELVLCPIASICKGADRNNNLESMIGVFTVEKMGAYSDEAENVFLPMLKAASKNFPEQHLAYQAIIEQMKKTITFVRHYVMKHHITKT